MERGGERERAGASEFVTARKGKEFPRERENEEDGKKRRDRKREIRENYTEAMEEKNCHKSTLSSSQLDLLDPHVQYETLKSI